MGNPERQPKFESKLPTEKSEQKTPEQKKAGVLQRHKEWVKGIISQTGKEIGRALQSETMKNMEEASFKFTIGAALFILARELQGTRVAQDIGKIPDDIFLDVIDGVKTLGPQLEHVYTTVIRPALVSFEEHLGSQEFAIATGKVAIGTGVLYLLQKGLSHLRVGERMGERTGTDSEEEETHSEET